VTTADNALPLYLTETGRAYEVRLLDMLNP